MTVDHWWAWPIFVLIVLLVFGPWVYAIIEAWFEDRAYRRWQEERRARRRYW